MVAKPRGFHWVGTGLQGLWEKVVREMDVKVWPDETWVGLMIKNRKVWDKQRFTRQANVRNLKKIVHLFYYYTVKIRTKLL